MPDSFTAQNVIDKAMAVVDEVDAEITERLAVTASGDPVRPSAAEVAKRRPSAAEPKPSDTPAPKVTVVASGHASAIDA